MSDDQRTTAMDVVMNMLRSAKAMVAPDERSQSLHTASSSARQLRQRWHNPASAPGDIIYGGSDGQMRVLHIGNEGDVLHVESGYPVWGPYTPGPACIISGMVNDNGIWGPDTFEYVITGCEMSVTIPPEPPPQFGWGAAAHADSGVPVTTANWESVIEGENGTGVNWVGVRYLDNENWTSYWQVIEAWFVADSTNETVLTMLYSDNDFQETDTILMDEPGTFRMTTTKTGDSVTTIYESPPGTVKGSFTIDSAWAANSSGIGNVWIEVVMWSESPTGVPGGTGSITNLTLEPF